MYTRLGPPSTGFRRWNIHLPAWLVIFGTAMSTYLFMVTDFCQNDLENLCVYENRSTCVPPLVPFDAKFRSAAKFQFGACPIEKAMSTILVAITCYMHDPVAFESAKRSLTNDLYENRFCKDKNEYKSMHELLSRNHLSATNSSKWMFLAVVRDPIDRFLSGYADKCIKEEKRKTSPNRCYGCARNLTCFVERLYSRAIRYGSGDSRSRSYEDIHFFPQNWHCNFNLFFSRFKFVKFHAPTSYLYEKMIEELSEHLIEHEVKGSVIHKIIDSMRVDQTQHSTGTSNERYAVEKELRSRPDLIRRLVQIFYYDYVLFGFDLPKI